PVTAPRANYTLVGEAIRFMIPSHMQCSVGCGGRSCKYDSPIYWRDDQQAIKGLYSSWVTDHLLASSRPSTQIIDRYNIIDQFKRNGIKTVINLQIPGEHADCGSGLEPESGFSYCPEVFMENDIYFYNFGMSDYGVANLSTVLDMVKVVAFALQEGKIAVHCHAGLGRTGVLLACFLVYATKMTANQAILFVRARRPGSIQTRGQLCCVRDFVRFLTPLRSVFSCADPRSDPVTLAQYLNRQRLMLHGTERKELRHLPKIVQLVCRLLRDIAENRQVIEEDVLEAPDVHDIEMTLSIVEKLGPETFAKKPHLPGMPTLPRHFNEPPIFYHHKSLSYSETDLRRLGSELNLLTQPLGSLSQSNADVSVVQGQGWTGNVSDVSQNSTGSLWQHKNDGSTLLKTTRPKPIQRSESVGNHKLMKKGGLWSRSECELTRTGCGAEAEEQSEVPFITLQSELSLENRRLLVAQALALDLFLDGEEKHKNKLSVWKAELNRGGAWETLCTEQDPFILTGLMWAWLEQLKEPVISMQEAKALNSDTRSDVQTVLDTLDHAHKQTLACVLDCMAHMLEIPEEVEAAFLRRTIKAFTWMDFNSVETKAVHESMTAVLRSVLGDMRSQVTDETHLSPLLSTQ
ncbi:protein tyrosine phosphatase domain-containing protein 1, partial [Cynoglossus semilaevis]|uniref:protein tyrosine phosphatase domain-containing protein 1 n=1 Tax=Cynoglossus semilaevis TaxID=244447 RepID=UPI000D62A850